MNEENKSLDEQIRKAQLRKLEAEALKAESEHDEMERLRKLPWYRPQHPFKALTQAVVAGIVAVPLIWFYVKDIALPLSDRENIRLSKENIATRDSLENVKAQISATKDSLERVGSQLTTISDSLRIAIVDNQALLSRISKLQIEFGNLGKEFSLTKQQKDKFERTVRLLEEERKSQQETSVNLSAKLKAVNAPRFRSTPDLSLSGKEAATMLKKHGFYCKKYDWSKNWSNPDGKGIGHAFQKQSNGQVVFDGATGLYWQQDGSPKRMNYANARSYIADLNRTNFSGYSDWRLPTLEEGMSLMEREKKNGDLYIDPVFDKAQRWIWTADKSETSAAWGVSFTIGYCNVYLVDYDYFVRAVRSGQSLGI